MRHQMKEHRNDIQAYHIRKRRNRVHQGVSAVSTLTIDIDVAAQQVSRSKSVAPTHRILGRSLLGWLFERDVVGMKHNRDNGANLFALTVRDYGFNAHFVGASNRPMPHFGW